MNRTLQFSVSTLASITIALALIAAIKWINTVIGAISILTLAVGLVIAILAVVWLGAMIDEEVEHRPAIVSGVFLGLAMVLSAFSASLSFTIIAAIIWLLLSSGAVLNGIY